jgi:L-alanine-DL-glutamate epimerase-like enolase superfamily enzyme
LPRGFLPFLQNQALDVVHPDLAFCGGITSAKKIADIASLYRIPVATHNVGSLVLLMASVHFGAGIFDYVMSENALDKGQHVESMGTKPVQVNNSFIAVPTAPGLGVDLSTDFLKTHMAPGETWWG